MGQLHDRLRAVNHIGFDFFTPMRWKAVYE